MKNHTSNIIMLATGIIVGKCISDMKYSPSKMFSRINGSIFRESSIKGYTYTIKIEKEEN